MRQRRRRKQKKHQRESPSVGTAAAEAESTIPAVMSLITQSDDDTILLHDDAVKAVLQPSPATAKRPVAVVAILGGARTGKSTCLNMLTGRQLFATADGVVPCTKGADVSTYTPTVAQLRDHVVVPHGDDDDDDDDGGPRVMVVDVEGQGDRGATYDIRMSAPVILIARVVVMNVKGQPTRALLEDLDIALGVQDHLVEGDGGGPAAHAAGRRPQSCLVIRCGDVNTTGKDAEASAKAYIFDDEAADPDVVLGKVDKIRRRNAIRQRVRDVFASVDVFLTPFPLKSGTDIGREPLSEGTATLGFLKAMRRMRLTIADKVRQPSAFQGMPLTGATTAAALRAAIGSLNSDTGKIVPSTMHEYMHREEVANVKQVCQQRLEAAACGIPHTVVDDDELLLPAGDYTAALRRELQHVAEQARKEDVPAHLHEEVDEAVKEMRISVEKHHIADHAERMGVFIQAIVSQSRKALDAVLGEDVLAAGTPIDAATTAACNWERINQHCFEAENKVRRVDTEFVIDATALGATGAGARIAAAAVQAVAKVTKSLDDLAPWDTVVKAVTEQGHTSFVEHLRVRLAERRVELQEAAAARKREAAANARAAAAASREAKEVGELKKRIEELEERLKPPPKRVGPCVIM